MAPNSRSNKKNNKKNTKLIPLVLICCSWPRFLHYPLDPQSTVMSNETACHAATCPFTASTVSEEELVTDSKHNVNGYDVKI